MECSKCGSQAGEFLSGISKKNNKPWRGWKCGNNQCMNMQFLPTNNQGAPPPPKSSPSLSQDKSPFLDELKRQTELLAKILGALRAEKQDVTTEPEECAPDQEVPF